MWRTFDTEAMGTCVVRTNGNARSKRRCMKDGRHEPCSRHETKVRCSRSDSRSTCVPRAASTTLRCVFALPFVDATKRTRCTHARTSASFPPARTRLRCHDRSGNETTIRPRSERSHEARARSFAIHPRTCARVPSTAWNRARLRCDPPDSHA